MIPIILWSVGGRLLKSIRPTGGLTPGAGLMLASALCAVTAVMLKTRLTAGAGSSYFGASGGPQKGAARSATLVRPSTTHDPTTA